MRLLRAMPSQGQRGGPVFASKAKQSRRKLLGRCDCFGLCPRKDRGGARLCERSKAISRKVARSMRLLRAMPSQGQRGAVIASEAKQSRGKLLGRCDCFGLRPRKDRGGTRLCERSEAISQKVARSMGLLRATPSQGQRGDPSLRAKRSNLAESC